MRLRKAIVALVACAAAVSGSFGLAAPAAAVNNDGIGDPGELVMFRDTFYAGQVYDEYWALSDYRTRTFIGSGIRLNDEVSSAYNFDAGYYVRIHKDINCTGPFLELTPYGTSFWFVDSLIPYGLNDQPSSHCWHV